MMKRIAIATALVMATMISVQASELKLIAGGSLAGLFKQLGPQFEKASGHTLSIHFDSTPNIISRTHAAASALSDQNQGSPVIGAGTLAAQDGRWTAAPIGGHSNRRTSGTCALRRGSARSGTARMIEIPTS